MTEDFYSVIYVAPNHLTNEKISIGLIVVSGGVPYFNFSMSKLKWLSFDLIKAPAKKHLNEIQSIMDAEQKSKVLRLFNYRFAKEVFEELHKKSRGLILFDAPNEIHQNIDEQFFNKLFEELIGAKPKRTAEKKHLPMRVKWTHWLRQQENLSGIYQFSLEEYPWAKVDYAIIHGDEISIYHCIDPEISKKSFNLSLSKFDLTLGVIGQNFSKVDVKIIHGDNLSKSGNKVLNSLPQYVWIKLSEAQNLIS